MPDKTDALPEPFFDLAIEEAALGCAFGDLDRAQQLLDATTPEDFFDPFHQALRGAIAEVTAMGVDAEPLALARALQDGPAERMFENRGALLAAIHRIDEAALGSTISMRYWAQILADLTTRRRLVRAGRKIMDAARDAESAQAALASAEREVKGCARAFQVEDRRSMFNDALARLEQDRDARSAYYGVMLIDNVTRGIAPGEVTTIAAQPGVGKSIVGVQAAAYTAGCMGRPVLMAAIEMGKRKTIIRAIAAILGVPYKELWGNPALSLKRKRAADLLYGLPIEFVEGPLSSAQIAAHARRVKNERGDLGLVVVDVVKRMTDWASSARAGENTAYVAGRAFVGLVEGVAQALDVPVLAIHHIKTSSSKRPVLGDIADTADLGKESSQVIFLHPVRDDLDRISELEFIIAKNRDGPPGFVSVAVDLPRYRIGASFPLTIEPQQELLDLPTEEDPEWRQHRPSA